MNKKTNTLSSKLRMKDNATVYLAILLSAVTFFSITYYAVFAVHDDMYSYLIYRLNQMWPMAYSAAIGQGRIGFMFLNLPLTYLPFLGNSLFFYKLCSVAAICFDMFALAFLLRRHVGEKTALLAVAIFFVFAQIDYQHNLFIAYVFNLQIPIGFCLLSIDQLLAFYQEKKNGKLIRSSILLFLAACLSETFLLFSAALFPQFSRF